MIREDYFNRLVDACPVRYYASGVDGARVHWPWRMNKAGSSEFRQAFVEACDHHILDSNFKDDSVTNRDVLDEAADRGCDGAVLADVYQNAEATIPALLDGLELYEEHHFDGLLVLPLQDPYDEVYDAVEPSVGDLDVWWAIGGLKDENAAVKVRKTRQFREHVGPGPHVHGLGFGVTDVLAAAVRKDPGLLDSIDNSTAVSNTVSGLRGAEQTTVTAMKAQAKRVENLRKLTHYAGDPDDPAQIRPMGQRGLAEIPATDGGPDG